MREDYYAVMGVDGSATTEQIRVRFRELARELHPDRFQGEEKVEAEARFQSITEAFNTLRDPERRRSYDRESQESRPTDSGQDPKRLLQVYMQRGVSAFQEGRFAEAAESFQRATKADGSDPRGWHCLAQACAKQEPRLSVAMSAIQKACELEPMNVSYLKMAGELFARGGLTLRAEKFYNQALKWGGPNTDIEFALAELRT